MTEGRPVRIIYAIRGSRGVEVNREVIGQFREFRDRINWQDFVLTSSRDTAKKRDHVLEKEYLAVTEDLQAAGYDFTYEENLTDSIKRVLAEVRPDEFMVLAGSHNMDQGARIALNLLAASKPEDERGAILEILQGRLMG